MPSSVSRELFVCALFAAAALYALVLMARRPGLDIGFGRAEAIALEEVHGHVRGIARTYQEGHAVFRVEVRTAGGAAFEVSIDADEGRVLGIVAGD